MHIPTVEQLSGATRDENTSLLFEYLQDYIDLAFLQEDYTDEQVCELFQKTRQALRRAIDVTVSTWGDDTAHPYLCLDNMRKWMKIANSVRSREQMIDFVDHFVHSMHVSFYKQHTIMSAAFGTSEGPTDQIVLKVLDYLHRSIPLFRYWLYRAAV